MRRLKGKLGFDITPHGFRHSITTDLLLAGVPITQVKNITGHTQLKTLQIYDRSNSNQAIGILQTGWRKPAKPEPPKETKKQKRPRKY